MQWLTAILAFATTMLVFAVVVAAFVETIHRVFRCRTLGLMNQLGHFYDQVLLPHLQSAGVTLEKEKFVDEMTLVRAPTSGGLFAWCFRRLSTLPKEAFMERLGSTAFAEVFLEAEKKSETNGKQLLKDIAQKYETIGMESSRYFESWARLTSVIVAILVAWTFYVNPYDLVQTYLRNPETAGKVAALADGSMERYEELIKEAEDLRKKQGDDQNDDLNELVGQLAEDMKDAREQVDVLSQAGAPVGWPEDEKLVGKFILYEGSIAKQARMKKEARREEKNKEPETGDENGQGKSGQDDKQETVKEDEPTGLSIVFYYPKRLKDVFWLLVGGLLIGLGAPFWARFVSQLTQARDISKTLAGILKPEAQQPGQQQVAAARAMGTPAPDDSPVTSHAFMASANSRKMVESPSEESDES